MLTLLLTRPLPHPHDVLTACGAALGCAADDRLIISFAPNTLALLALKRIGELFPGPSKVRCAALARQARLSYSG